MSWTSPEIVKLHLQSFSVDALSVFFYPVFLNNNEAIQLPHNTLIRDSVKLYINISNVPSGPHSIILYNTAWTSAGANVLFPGSVILSEDDLGRNKYCEGADFVVDPSNGRVKRLADSTIVSGQEVQCWFIPLQSFVLNSDYELDEIRGLITRLPTGDIPETASLLVSYQTSAAGATDALISQVISEAEAKITSRLNDDYTAASEDIRLTMGATELTIALICDDLAVRSLTAVGDTSADDRAKRFMDLAKRYEERAISTLSPCLRHPLPSPSKTSASTGGINW